MTDDPVITLIVDTPAGRMPFVAELVVTGQTLLLKGVHVQDLQPNVVGPANLRVIARALMERMEFDEIVVEGAVRTTGANPGRRPSVLRFTRTLRPAPAGGQSGTKDP